MSDFIDLDFTGVDRGPKMVAEGEQILTITNVERKKSKNKNEDGSAKADSIHVTFQDAEGVNVRSFFSLNPNALWSLRLFLEAVTGDELDGAINISPQDLIGASVIATVVHEDRTDNPQLKNARITAYQYAG